MRVLKLIFVAVSLAVSSLAIAEVPVVDAYQQADNSNSPQADNSANQNASSASTLVALPTDQRVAILEQQVTNLKQLLSQMSALQQQVQDLRGQLELQSHNVQVLQDQVRTQYQDLDHRIGKPTEEASNKPATKLRSKTPNKATITTADSKDTSSSDDAANTSTSTDTTPDTDTASDSTKDDTQNAKSDGDNATSTAAPSKNKSVDNNGGGSPSKDQVAYQAAFKLLKDKKYDQAATGFQTYLKKYPSNKNAVNARYWLGQLYLLQGQPDKAVGMFKTILKNNPNDAKAADTTLQLGLAYYAKGDLALAKTHLTKVQQQYPNSPAAQLASTRLKQMLKSAPADTSSGDGAG